MQPETPWNVAGIAPEARDAARTSARREGLSVGEWLTRRILHGLPDAGVDEWWFAENGPGEPGNENAVQNGRERIACPPPDPMPLFGEKSHSRVEAKSTVPDIVAAAKIPHSESETEQLRDRIVRLDARLARAEIRAAGEEAKQAEAMRTLAARLAELSNQLCRTATHSAETDTQLAKAIEGVTGKFLRSLEEAEEQRDGMRARIAALADDTASRAEETQRSQEENKRQLRAVEERVATAEAALVTAGHDRVEVQTLAGSLDQLTRRYETSEAEYLNNIERFESRLARIEAEGGDSVIDPRLQGIERALAEMTKLIEKNTPQTPSRSTEPPDAQGDFVQLHNAPPPASPTSAAAAMPILDFPPFPERARPFATPPDAASPGDLRAAGEGAGLSEAPPPAQAGSRSGTDVQHAAVDNAAQTRSAPFSWIDPADQKPKSEPTHTRLILLGALGLLVLLAVGTGFYLSNTQQPDVAPIAAKAAYQAPRITRGTPHAAAVRAAAYKGSGARSVVGPYHATAVQKTVAAPTAIPGAGAATRANPFQRVAALASGGNARAEEVLGLDYLDGDGVAVNEAEGAKWLERAAAQGEAVAAWRLGTLYERGHGVAADPAKATQWYAVAARAGNRKAMHNLAVAYAQGSGIAKDLPLAVQWFSRAANLGLADSQFNLAVLYERGLGVPPSLAKAYKWYAVAAAEGDAESRARMEAIAPQLSAADKAAAEKFRAQFQPARLDAAANVPPVAASMQ